MRFDFSEEFIILPRHEKTILLLYFSSMRSIVLLALVSTLLASCSLTPKAPENQSPTDGIPKDVQVQTGSVYPAVPLDQYQKMQSGASTESGNMSTSGVTTSTNLPL